MTSRNDRPSRLERTARSRPHSGPVVPSPGDDHGEPTAGRTARGVRTSPGRRCAPRGRPPRERGRAARRAERQGRSPAGRGARGAGGGPGPGPDDRDPQPFGRLVSRVSLDRGWSPRLTDATVLGRWPQLVGPDIADHCTPVSLRDGELVLQAESTAWATQLRTLQRQLLARLAAAVGPDVVRRIRVVGPSGAELAARPAARPRPGPARHLRLTPARLAGADSGRRDGARSPLAAPRLGRRGPVRFADRRSVTILGVS